MGILECKKHGRSGFHETCEHIRQEIEKGIYPNYYNIKYLNMLICESCWKKYELEELKKHTNFWDKKFWEVEEENELTERYEQIYDSIDRRCWCVQCKAELEVKIAKQNGKLEPFPVFEKTLWSIHKNKIAEFREFLTANFKFRPSIVQKKSLALSIVPGNYTYPLTVTIYYVVSEDQQDKIVQLIEKFFQNIEFNQVKILFYEAEVWETWSNPEMGVSGGQRGTELLLKEVLLNI